MELIAAMSGVLLILLAFSVGFFWAAVSMRFLTFRWSPRSRTN